VTALSWSPSGALDRDLGDKVKDAVKIGEANMAPQHVLLALLLGRGAWGGAVVLILPPSIAFASLSDPI